MKLRSLSVIPAIIAVGLLNLVLITGCKKKPDIPTITTVTVSGITINSASSGGNVTSDGGAEVTAKGICWGSSHNPLTTGSHTTDGTGSGSFTSQLSGLAPGTLYYVRAYGTNSAGTGYGNEVTFTTNPLALPEITTTVVTEVTLTTAKSGGTITSDGGANVTARGLCWKTEENPTVSDSKTTDGSGSGSFTSELAGLQPGTLYYVRAYATNSVGTVYGNELSFTTGSIQLATVTTTIASSVTSNSATSGGNVTSDGGGAVTARGVCWSTSANPDISGSKTSNGTGTGSFTSSLTGLQPGTEYHIRAYATNSAGTAYGSDLTFTTPAVVPTIITTNVTGATQTSATSGGNVTASGGATVTARGICWSTSNNPTLAGSHTTDGNGTGSFTSTMTGLTPNTTYYVRAYATNSAGTAYGNEVSFISTPVSLAVLTTVVPSSVTLSSAVSGGNITFDGGAAVTARGVCWSTSVNPTTSDQHTTNGSGTGSFSSNIAGLTDETRYYVRAYATNSAGTAYGDQISFSTSLTDVEGNVYKTAVIGNQVWMAENLKTVTFNDNTAIPNVTDNAEWSTLTTPAYCWYNNNITYRDQYGALYNWFTITTDKLCPTGWHVASDDEYKTLEAFLGMASGELDLWGWRGTDQGSQMKTTTGWGTGGNGTNSSGFSALPGGYRFAVDGTFQLLGSMTYWWTSTPNGTGQGWYRRIDAANTDVYRASTLMGGGKYIRCVKN